MDTDTSELVRCIAEIHFRLRFLYNKGIHFGLQNPELLQLSLRLYSGFHHSTDCVVKQFCSVGSLQTNQNSVMRHKRVT